ncbi:MAG: serine protease [Planctomycetes bacterium]|nr:serine protease [Planctomycetota bacterium]
MFTGVFGELTRVSHRARPSLVRIQVDGKVFKPFSRYLLGVGETLFGALNPHPYWEWPYRVIRFPLYLLFGHLDLSSSRGSGFFVADDLVLTCAHVIDNAAEIRCQLDDGRLLNAEIVSNDVERDLALLRVTGLKGPQPPPLQLRRTAISPGEVALALGYPSREPIRDPMVPRAPFDEDKQIPNPRVTVGVVSAVNVQLGNALTRYVELDAALNPGNSGGPILGLDGQVMGVATMVSVGKENEGYAVPAETVLAIFAEHLGEGRQSKREAPESRE